MAEQDPAIQLIVNDVKQAEKYADTAKMYIAMMKEAGEDTSTLETDLRKSEIRLTKWKQMLQARGYYK